MSDFRKWYGKRQGQENVIQKNGQKTKEKYLLVNFNQLAHTSFDSQIN